VTFPQSFKANSGLASQSEYERLLPNTLQFISQPVIRYGTVCHTPSPLKITHNPFPTGRSRGSVVGIATGYGLHGRSVRSSRHGRVKNFLFSTSSIPALGPTQPPIQWVQGAVSPGENQQGRETDHQLLLRSRKRGSIHPFPHTP
jgi:hypothetical protein